MPDSKQERRFPILGGYNDVERGEEYPLSVSWDFVSKFAEQAENNHAQSLKRLAERGGLSVEELWCAAHGLRLNAGFKQCGGPKNAIKWLMYESAGADWRQR